MRAVSAWFIVLLGGGAAFAQVACSSDASSGVVFPGAAGEAGASDNPAGGGSSIAGSGGSSGAVSTGGDAGACAFESTACTTCLQDHCFNQATACYGDATCGGPLSDLDTCACSSGKTADECETTFVTDGGSKATPLVECFVEFCMSACQ